MHRKGLVIGILILMLGVNIGSTFAGDVDVKTMSSVGFDGNTLYVGGSGPGNYSSIQGAIDDTVDGDTVFVYSGVYDDYNPDFLGCVNINKSIPRFLISFYGKDVCHEQRALPADLLRQVFTLITDPPSSLIFSSISSSALSIVS